MNDKMIDDLTQNSLESLGVTQHVKSLFIKIPGRNSSRAQAPVLSRHCESGRLKSGASSISSAG